MKSRLSAIGIAHAELAFALREAARAAYLNGGW